MKVSLINYTPNALELLLFTKQTRLSQDAGLMEEIKSWPIDRKMKELNYMRGTIQSSWEFVDATFSIEGVSRAFTHQLVRTRAGSYAQQSQRTVNMDGFDYIIPDALNDGTEKTEELNSIYNVAMKQINDRYADLIQEGAIHKTQEEYCQQTYQQI